MINIEDRPCDEELVSLLYYVLLGREPESSDIWLGVPLSEASRVILGSDEFRLIASSCLALEFAGPRVEKSRPARSAAADKLVRYGATRPRTDLWHNLLLSGLEWLRTVPLNSNDAKMIEAVIKVITAEYRGAPDVDDILDDAFRFDRDWFLAAHKEAAGLSILSDDEIASYAAQATLNGEAELSPYFLVGGERNRQLRQAVFGAMTSNCAPSFDQVVRSIRNAAQKGIIGHWLFDEQYYIRERELLFTKKRHLSWKPLQNAYLDFLVNGNMSQLSPHPLFNTYSYRLFNSTADVRSTAFDHYLRVGQFYELRTSALFDPAFYIALTPSVRIDLANRRFGSALESFCAHGVGKDYPFCPDFDSSYYLANYNDAVDANREHAVSAGWHFLTIGAREGRPASPYFDPAYYSERYPAVKAKCEDLSISLLEHYLLMGKNEGLRPSKPLVDRSVDIFQAKAIYERRALDSLVRLTRKPLDFSPFSGPDPILSVVVPVHGQVAFTARFLDLAFFACGELKRRTGGSSEIIVISNGSTDTTSALIKAMVGIKSCIVEDSIGYTRAANRGAQLAAGRYVLFVNNDVEFDPAVFADLIASFTETPNCGVLGPRILSMDMTVQENGSFVATDGRTGGYDRGARSSHQSSVKKHMTDYVSGCFLCVERADFEAIGGFDDAFSPGYYEDVDLCLRVREVLGKEVVVDPGMSIIHYENASFMKGRPIAVSYPSILRNRQMILRKHPGISAGSADKRRDTSDKGRRGERRTKILVIADKIPDPRLGVRHAREADILRVIRDEGVSYDVLALSPSEDVDDYEFVDVALFRSWISSESVDELLRSEVATYTHIWLCALNDAHILSHLLAAYKHRHAVTIICDANLSNVKCASQVFRMADPGSSDADVTDDAEATDLLALGLSSGVADQLVAKNEGIAGLIRSVGFERVSTIGHCLGGNGSRAGRGDGSRIVIAGDGSALPANVQNLLWFADFVMPKIAHLQKTFTLVGEWPQALLHLVKRRHPNLTFEFTGELSRDALDEIYRDTVLTASPFRVAPDEPDVIIEAVSRGTPIVFSRPLAEQIGIAERNFDMLSVASIDDQGEDMASAIVRLSTDGERWKAVRDEQRTWAASEFSREAFARQVRCVLAANGVEDVPYPS